MELVNSFFKRKISSKNNKNRYNIYNRDGFKNNKVKTLYFLDSDIKIKPPFGFRFTTLFLVNNHGACLKISDDKS